MNILKKIILSFTIISLFISCVGEEKLDKTSNIIITVKYKGNKKLDKMSLFLFDFEKGLDSKEIFSYTKENITFPHLFKAENIKYGNYKVLIYATKTGESFDKDRDPFFIVEKLVVEKKDYDLTYTIIAKDECDPNPCLNGSTCTKIDETKYSCKCLDKFSGKNCEIQETRDLSCLGKSCSTGCNCDANYCIPNLASHAGAQSENICTLKSCRGNETICPEGYECIDSHRGDVNSFCSKKTSTANVGEIEFKLTYTGTKTIKKIGIGIYNDSNYKRRFPPFAASSENIGNISFPYSFKVKATSTGTKYIWIYGDINGDLFPNSSEPQYKGQINITSEPQVIDIELK